jgi:hypothetical protein
VGVIVLAIILVVYVFLIVPARRGWVDRGAVTDLRAGLAAPVRELDENSKGYAVVEGLRVGEVVRHFDQQTSGAISGWLDHRLAFGGWGVGATVGRVGLGTGSIGLSGASQVHLGLEATTRANLLGDGWIAVLERPTAGGMVDVTRLVVPSEAAVVGFLEGVARSLAEEYRAALPECASTVLALAGRIRASSPTDISYVGDRLAAILRLPVEQRPPLTVIGVPLGEHAILGGAVRIGGEDRVHRLVPFELIERWLLLPGATNAKN